MATSGTHTFNLDISDIMEEAYDLCGLELRSGYSFRGAKRALNLVFLEWQNKGLNLWTVEQGSVSVTEGTSSYTVDASALDIVDVFIRTDAGDETKQFDQRLNRISRTEYNHQSNKLLQAKPTQFYVDKDSGSIKLVLWSTPDKAYTLVYDYIQRIEDTGDVASNNVDVPSRYLPCFNSAIPPAAIVVTGGTTGFISSLAGFAAFNAARPSADIGVEGVALLGIY